MKQVWFTAAVICSLMFFSHQVFADDESTDENETPAYSNSAQAAHAANLADEVAASHPETEEAADDVKEAEENVADAEETLANTNPDDEAARAKAEADLAEAESDLEKANVALDAKVGEIAGVASDDIERMRTEEGMGWGEIAHELGVHPGTLGLGHNKAKGNKNGHGFSDPESEIAEATRRDVEHGWANGHGQYASKSSSGKKGLGLSETGMAHGSKASNGKSGGKGSNSKGGAGSSSKGNSQGGKSNDHGNNGNGNDKGGNGGGHGGGNGGGNGGGCRLSHYSD
ncbi:MAG: hypothetical protein GY799_18990 [Desulfobulbaceae bacterium]|nr:hypothetical protein [Desulfobulbaceae bacterium]